LTNNYNKTKEWLSLAFRNVERVIKNYQFSDYSECVYKIQISIEQLQKALILLLGLQFRKIHDPSKILDLFTNNNSLEIEIEILNRIKEVAFLAKGIEGEGTATRYGTIEEGKLISPEDKFGKLEADKYLKDLKNILLTLKEIFKEIPYLKQDIPLFIKFIKKCEDLLLE